MDRKEKKRKEKKRKEKIKEKKRKEKKIKEKKRIILVSFCHVRSKLNISKQAQNKPSSSHTAGKTVKRVENEHILFSRWTEAAGT
jgi:hypothetical protein